MSDYDDEYTIHPGDEPKVYVFPVDADESWPMPDDFWDRLRRGLASVGLDYETC